MWILWLAMAVLFIGVRPSNGQSPRADDLSSRAEQILTKHCFSCHGQDPKNVQAGLRVLDINDLKTRGLLRPELPFDSELINRVEDGTMPPLNRPGLVKADRDALRAWVQAGAPPFPDKLASRAYVIEQILEDQNKIPGPDRSWVRYLSLNHLRGEKTEEQLEEYRTALNAATASLSRLPSNRVQPLSIEKTRTIFRIDLRHHGWDRKPYDGQPLNLWDLVLLEYPYGIFETTGPNSQEIANRFLLPAKQVRPISFVHADWFVWLASEPEFTRDFLQVPFAERKGDPDINPAIIEIAKRYADRRVTLSMAAEELGTRQLQSTLKAALVSPAFSNDGLQTLASQAAVDRQTWESHFPQLVRALGLGIPIEPVDATLNHSKFMGLDTGLKLKTNHPENVFAPGDRAKIIAHNATGRPMYGEVVAFSTWVVRICDPSLIRSGESFESEEFTIDNVAHKDEVILFACSKEFPGYQVVGGGADKVIRDEAQRIQSRIVHPFYKLERAGNEVVLKADPGPVIRQRITVETRVTK